MEVALRAMNLLAAFALFLSSPRLDEDALAELLTMFDQHGAHIRRNLEYSHIATSNHYMCDVAGLLWLGIMLPELQAARAWRKFGLRELLAELDKQILPDGADSESSTGYHRLKLEPVLYSFELCRENRIEIDEKHREKIRAMADYTRAYLRPDGHAPLIGDSDSGQILPIVKRAGRRSCVRRQSGRSSFQRVPGSRRRQRFPKRCFGFSANRACATLSLCLSRCLPNRKRFAMPAFIFSAKDDLYLLFNASGCGLNGRGSHGHNDALSVEVSAFGTAFLVDPGSYVYTADLSKRHSVSFNCPSLHRSNRRGRAKYD